MNKKRPGIKSIIETTKNPPMPPSVAEIEEYSVAEWCPTPDGSGPPEQVHFMLKIRGVDLTFVMRLKSRRAANELIATLTMHTDNVWPPEKP